MVNTIIGYITAGVAIVLGAVLLWSIIAKLAELSEQVDAILAEMEEGDHKHEDRVDNPSDDR